MYKFMIIDDEPYVLQHISQLLVWEEYGFDFVGGFDDSQDAMEYIMDNEIDFILTDIKMPRVSGIDIAKYCHENSPTTIVAFLTGFREFEYAQKAIVYGVSEYLVKPIMPESLIETLTKCYKELEKRKSSSSKFFASNELILETQNLFANLLCGVIDSEEQLKVKFEEHEFDTSYIDNPCVILNLHIVDYSDYITNKWKHGHDRLFNAISSIIYSFENGYFFSVIRHSYNNIEIIGYSSSPVDEEFSHANAAINKLAGLLESSINLETEVTNIDFFEKISLLIRAKPISKIEEFAHENMTINKVYEFIEENYNKSISTRDAAAHVFLSPVYFSIFYKQHTNETFTDTLNMYRVKMAKEILKSTEDIKPSMIYMDLGFTNQGHFYKVFKKHTGMTPYKYRVSLNL